jgi:osmoprotectant transport system ATP-binding protein
MLMDEPFGAIDPITRARLQDEFLRLHNELRKTVIFVTHDIDEAIKMGDRIAILREGGQLAQYDTPDGILGNPADEFVERFVGPDRALKRLALRQLGELDLHPLDGAALPDAPRLPRDASQRTAISVLVGAHADRLVVTDGDGRDLGLVTRDDLLT